MNMNMTLPEKTAGIWLLAAVVGAPAAFAQHVTMLEVRKDGAEDSRTVIEIRVPMDIQGLDMDNPMDVEMSGLSRLADDRGTDLLQIHEAQQAVLREQGYSTQPVLSFGGVADYSANEDIKLRVTVDAAASEGAGQLHVEGTVVFNFAGDGETEALEVADVPVEMPYDSEGFATEIGPIIVSSDGSAELNGVTYRKFTVSATKNAIVSAKPMGGDDSGEVDFWAVGENQFVLKQVPEVVALELRYTPLRKVPVEFDLEFSVGL